MRGKMSWMKMSVDKIAIFLGSYAQTHVRFLLEKIDLFLISHNAEKCCLKAAVTVYSNSA
jgi:hypothetical protein